MRGITAVCALAVLVAGTAGTVAADENDDGLQWPASGFWVIGLFVSIDLITAVEDFLDDVTTISGRFEQELIDADDAVVEESSGTLDIQRPGRFRWSYTEPYRQDLIADGTNLWSYDVDLEQVVNQWVGAGWQLDEIRFVTRFFLRLQVMDLSHNILMTLR